MSVLTLAALIFSIIAILLWIVTFLQSRPLRKSQPLMTDPDSHDLRTVEQEPGLPTMKSPEKDAEPSEDFLNDLTKFAQMVRKNLEILNTRIGVKFDIKPLLRKSQEKEGGKFVDSVEVDSSDVTETGKNQEKKP